VDAVAELETALGAELLRADLLGAPRPRLGQRYTIERFLGRGATGLVVAAQDERLGRSVALKLSVGGAESTGLGEARALARLDHPNVVRVFDVLVADQVYDGKPFRLSVVAMQRVPGRSLRVWLKEKHRSASEIVSVFLGAGAGLAAAHAEKIVHRDFKPDNVLVRDDGTAQVIDFGFAVPARSDVEAQSQTDVAGTASYLSPEARRGIATTKSDQFAFAISMVEALTGQALPPTEVTMPPGVLPQLWLALLRAANADPRKRFARMEDLLAELTKHRRGGVGWGTLFVLLLLAVWHFRAELGLTGAEQARGNAPGTPSVTATASSGPCRSAVGRWSFDTVVTDSLTKLAPGARGRYELELFERQSCLFAGMITRTTDAPAGGAFRAQARPVRAEIEARGRPSPGTVAVRVSDVRLQGCTYVYELSFSPDTLGGIFVAQCGAYGTYQGRITNARRLSR
jgi:hypothetical protein